MEENTFHSTYIILADARDYAHGERDLNAFLMGFSSWWDLVREKIIFFRVTPSANFVPKIII